MTATPSSDHVQAGGVSSQANGGAERIVIPKPPAPKIPDTQSSVNTGVESIAEPVAETATPQQQPTPAVPEKQPTPVDIRVDTMENQSPLNTSANAGTDNSQAEAVKTTLSPDKKIVTDRVDLSNGPHFTSKYEVISGDAKIRQAIQDHGKAYEGYKGEMQAFADDFMKI